MTDIEKCTTFDEYRRRYRHAFDVHHASVIYKQAAVALQSRALDSVHWWQWREVARLLDGTHRPILPDNSYWAWIYTDRRFYDYAPVVAASDATKVSYIPNAEYGVQDRRVITTLGRFLLANFAGRLLPDQIADLANQYSMQHTPPFLHVARKREEIISIYNIGGGMKSCMAGKPWRGDNPVAAYNNPEGTLPIGVAYVKDIHNGVIARCVVRLDRTPHEFGRIYGNEFAMRLALRNAGYVPAQQALHGCELAVIRKNGSKRELMVPYFDAPSRSVLVHIPSARAWASLSERVAANNILALHGLGSLEDHNSVLMETNQYGKVAHDSFMHLGDAAFSGFAQSPCSRCGTLIPKRMLHRVFNTPHTRNPEVVRSVCKDCLSDHYVATIVSSNPPHHEFVDVEDPNLLAIPCVNAYVLSPVDPEHVLDVVWSNYTSSYLRTGEAIRSPLVKGVIPKHLACAFRYLLPDHTELNKQRNRPSIAAPMEWVLEHGRELGLHVYVEIAPDYPHLLYALWLGDDEIFNELCEQSGDTNGKAPQAEAQWGHRIQRLHDWLLTNDKRVLRPEAVERFERITRCTVTNVLALYEQLHRDEAPAASEHARRSSAL